MAAKTGPLAAETARFIGDKQEPAGVRTYCRGENRTA